MYEPQPVVIILPGYKGGLWALGFRYILPGWLSSAHGITHFLTFLDIPNSSLNLTVQHKILSINSETKLSTLFTILNTDLSFNTYSLEIIILSKKKESYTFVKRSNNHILPSFHFFES